MTRDRTEQAIRDQFQALRRWDRAQAPPFAGVWNVAEGRTKTRRPPARQVRFLPSRNWMNWMPWAAVAATLIAVAVFTGPFDRDPLDRSPSFVESSTGSPDATASLLRPIDPPRSEIFRPEYEAVILPTATVDFAGWEGPTDVLLSGPMAKLPK